MQVVCEKTCAVRVDGAWRSLMRGKSYDLPRERAKALVRGGFARAAQGTPKKPEPPQDTEPESDEDPAPKKRPKAHKKLDGAPKNK